MKAFSQNKFLFTVITGGDYFFIEKAYLDYG